MTTVHPLSLYDDGLNYLHPELVLGDTRKAYCLCDCLKHPFALNMVLK